MRRKSYGGYFDMGRIRIPPVPSAIRLKDRTTTDVWFLTWETGDDLVVRPVLRDSAPTGYLSTNFTLYGDNTGPRLSEEPLMLYVSNGRMYYTDDINPHISDMDNQKVLAVQLGSRTFYRFVVPTGWANPPDRIAIREVTV